VLVSIGAAGAATLAYRAVSVYTRPPRRRLEHTLADVGLTSEELRLKAEDGLSIAAWYVPPRNGAVIIAVHGIWGNRGQLIGIGRNLVDRGFGIMLPDLRAHGDSDGRVNTLGLREARDVRACVVYLQSLPDPPAHIGVLGYSLGAATAIIAAAETPGIEAVVADSPFASVPWLLEHQFDALLHIPRWLLPILVRIGSRQTGVDAAAIAPMDYAARISPRTLLVIHGQEDGMFQYRNAELVYEAAREPKELWLLSGVAHAGAYDVDPEAYVARVADFFNDAFAAAPVGGPTP
jgi:dienelactone hydrolase